MRNRILLCLALVLLFLGVQSPAHAASIETANAARAAVSAPASPSAVQTAQTGIFGDLLCRSTGSAFRSKGIPFPTEMLCSDKGRKVVKESAKLAYKKLENSLFGELAKAARDFAGDIVKTGLTWWLVTPSVRLGDTGLFGATGDEPLSDAGLHAMMLGIGQLIAVLLVLFQAINTMIRRKGAPFADAMKGLAINAFLAAVGLTILNSLLIASDKVTEGILTAGFGEDKGDIADTAVKILLPTLGNPFGILAIAVIVLLIGLIQLLLNFLRQAAIPILALLLPIAGSGQIGGQNSRQWLPRLCTMILTIICYKPAAALILTVGFVQAGNASTIVDWFRGVVTLALSIIALPAMMKLFAPIGLTMSSSAGGSGGFAGMLGSGGALASGGGGGGGGATSASSHARDMESRSGGIPQQSQGQGQQQTAGGSAVDQSKNNAPQSSTAGGGATGGGAGTAAQGAKAGAGTASVVLVAAEAAHKGAQGAGNQVSGGNQS